jgi:competence protein ComEC
VVQALVMDGILTTLAASLMIMPLVAYHFDRVSVLGLVANLLIVPVQPWIMAWGSAGLALGVAGLPQVAQVLLWVPWLGLVWTVQVVHWVAALPGAQIAVAGFDVPALTLSYGLLALLLAHRRVAGWGRGALAWVRAAGGARRLQPTFNLLLGVAAILVWWGVLSRPDGRLHVWFLDVDQGDGILIQTPRGRQVLVDGGRHPSLLLSELGAVLPFWDRSLDLLVLTHPDGDHMDAQLEAAQRLAVGQAVTSAPGAAQAAAAAWQATLSNRGVPLTLLHAGGWIDLGDGVALWALWPPPGASGGGEADNEAALVIKLVYGDFSVLLTGDAGLASEARWIASGAPLAATVLKVGHHGSANSTGPEFVAAVNPQLAVIQVGAGNPYGHPAANVLEALAGRTVLRTDQVGRIHVISDGRQMWVTMEQE